MCLYQIINKMYLVVYNLSMKLEFLIKLECKKALIFPYVTKQATIRTTGYATTVTARESQSCDICKISLYDVSDPSCICLPWIQLQKDPLDGTSCKYSLIPTFPL